VALSPTKQKQLDARGSVVGSLPIEFLSEACWWERTNYQARTWSISVRPYRVTTSHALIPPRFAVRDAVGGSAIPTPRTRSGIHARCRPERKAARR